MLTTIKSLFSVATIGLSLILLSGCLHDDGKPYPIVRPDWAGRT